MERASHRDDKSVKEELQLNSLNIKLRQKVASARSACGLTASSRLSLCRALSVCGSRKQNEKRTGTGPQGPGTALATRLPACKCHSVG